MSSDVLMEVGDLVSTAQEVLVDTLSGPSRAQLQGEGLAVDCSEVSMVEEVISDHVPETGTEVSISSDPAPLQEVAPPTQRSRRNTRVEELMFKCIAGVVRSYISLVPRPLH